MKRFARGALTLAFWVAVWTALALLVNRELLLPAPWVVVRRLCELAATAAFWRITAVSIGRVLLGITAAVALGTGMAVACSVSKTADALLRPLMTVVKSTPVASFVVLALVWIARDWMPVQTLLHTTGSTMSSEMNTGSQSRADASCGGSICRACGRTFSRRCAPASASAGSPPSLPRCSPCRTAPSAA